MVTLLSSAALEAALSITDLTDKRNGHHALQQLVRDASNALTRHWQCKQLLLRTSPAVPLANNYDRLGYPPDGAARDARYTRYIARNLILRTQTSAAIPDLLAGLAVDPPDDLLLCLPGIVYRRDSIDRLHCAEPHQLDLWRITATASKAPMTSDDLSNMITCVMRCLLPGKVWRITPSPHPYTEQGVQIDVLWADEWIEVGECGIAARHILDDAGLCHHTGLAMGLGLDRILMIRKNIPDIRLLRSTDARVQTQLQNLEPWRAVSVMPAIRRDLSLCVDKLMDEESIGDLIRNQLPEADCLESLSIKSITAYENLPPSAHARMGMLPGQNNILLQIVIRHLERTLTDQEANDIRNSIYRLLHRGTRSEVALNG